MNAADLQSLIRENVKRLRPYSSARDDFQGNASVFLDANENPFESIYNRYPDPHQLALKKQIAELKNVKPEEIFLGNGSDEAIDLLLRAFCEPGEEEVLIPQPTYGMYSVSAEINRVDIKEVLLTSDFDIDVAGTLAACSPKTKIIFLCSPNNPSGNLLSFGKVIQLLESANSLIVVDEAYIDFARYPGFLPELVHYPNLVVLQTFSKAWGLAGLRLGMCFAHVDIIQALNKIKPPYNINSVTQNIASEALRSTRQMESWVAEILAERERLASALQLLTRVIKIYPSRSNFLLVKMTGARAVYQSLIRQGIVVRDRSQVVLCDDALRITVGRKEENQQLIEALKAL